MVQEPLVPKKRDRTPILAPVSDSMEKTSDLYDGDYEAQLRKENGERIARKQKG